MKNSKSILFGEVMILFVIVLISGISAATLNVGSGQAYTTIQAAIDSATSGDTINIVTGTYAENVAINEKTNLIIQGVGDTTIIEPASGIGFAITDSDSITINNLKIHTTGTNAHGIWVGGEPNGYAAMNGLTIQDTTIIVDGYSTGIYAEQVTLAHSGWLIGGAGHGNTITINSGTGVTGDGLDLLDVSNSEVSYNTITLNNPTDSTNVFWDSELSDISNLVFSNNILSGSSGSEVAFLNYAWGLGSPDTTTDSVTISGNTFSNWGLRALRINSEATNVDISNNIFEMTSDTEVIGGTGTDNTGTGNTFNINFPATIQKAINSAFPGDTINVAAGIYTEDLNIPVGKDNLELNGNGTAATIKGATLTDDSLGYYADSPNVMIKSSGVKIHGFTIESKDSDMGKHPVGIVLNSQNAEIYNNQFNVAVGDLALDYAVGIVTYCDNTICSTPVSSDISGLNIHNNNFTSLAGIGNYQAIYLNPDVGTGLVTIKDNNFGGSLARAIANERSNVLVQGNDVSTTLDSSNTFQGISAKNWWSQLINNINISGNSVDGFGKGIRIGPDTSNIIVKLNVLTNNVIAVSNENTNQLDATQNYWGTNIESEIQALVSGNVIYSPWNREVPLTSFATADAIVDISAGTIVTGDSSWDGTINAPTVLGTATVAPSTSGFSSTISKVIEVGFSGVKLIFDNAVKIVILGETGKLIGYSSGAIDTFHSITTKCVSAVDSSNIFGNGECYFDDGTNLIIWTKHFTEFVTYTQNADPSASSFSGGRGGGGSCSPIWSCTDWSACADGIQTRTCKDIQYCYNPNNQPAESQSCGVPTNTPAIGVPSENPEINGGKNQENNGLFSTITGAVVGALGTGGTIIAIVFVVGVLGTVIVFSIRKRK